MASSDDLARALLHRGRSDEAQRPALWAEARDQYLHLLESQPEMAAAWHDLAYMDFESGRFDRAEEEYRRAAGTERNSVPALHGLCISRVRLGRCREAVAACERCLELAPGSASCRTSLAGARACAR